jgi:hypothetical protein
MFEQAQGSKVSHKRTLILGETGGFACTLPGETTLTVPLTSSRPGSTWRGRMLS